MEVFYCSRYWSWLRMEPTSTSKVFFCQQVSNHQDFCRYCQNSSNEQKSDCLYYIYADAQPETSQGREGFMKLGHFYKHFLKNSRKKSHMGKFRSFFPRYCEKYILNGKFNIRMDKTRAFFTTIRTLFLFSKKIRAGLSLFTSLI